MVVTFRVYLSVNGGPAQLIQDTGPETSGAGGGVNIYDYADAEDVVSFWAVCSDIVGCSDFQTLPAEYTVPS